MVTGFLRIDALDLTFVKFHTLSLKFQSNKLMTSSSDNFTSFS